MTEPAAAKSLTLSPLLSAPAALRQVIDNLLSNAIKYSPRGTRVSLEVSGDSEHQRIVVRDQGPGISEGDRAKLFQKYGRGAATPTGGEMSTGLGLWIVQQIANGLHGQVRCDSEPGHGATFTFEVPSRRAA